MAHDPTTQAPPDHEHPTNADLDATQGPRVGSLAGLKWLALVVVGFITTSAAAIGIYVFLAGALDADFALAQEVKTTSAELAAETSERMEGDAEIASDVADVEERVSEVEQVQAAQAATAEAIDARLERIESGQDKLIEAVMLSLQEK